MVVCVRVESKQLKLKGQLGAKNAAKRWKTETTVAKTSELHIFLLMMIGLTILTQVMKLLVKLVLVGLFCA